jgi:MoxR-like ATPase
VSETTVDRRTRLLARTYAIRLNEVKREFVDRDEAVDVVGLATLCREHVLLVGPPGTAKSSLLDRFRRILDARYFSYLLTRFTEPAELFGPVDIRRFQAEGVYEVNTAGMLPEADVAFLDEVFQGSSAILNTLLTLVNERIFNTGSRVVDANLVTLLGSTNDIPDDPVLAAFGDRFLLRCRLDYVDDDDIEDLLALGWQRERDRVPGAGNPAGPGTAGIDIGRGNVGNGNVGNGAGSAGRTFAGLALADLLTLQRALSGVDLSGVRTTFARIVRALRAEGVSFSDRRAVKAQKAFAASALLAGRARADVADLAPLVYLWANARDEPTLRRIVADHDVPVLTPGYTARDPAEVRLELSTLRAQRERLSSAEEYRELLRLGRRLAVELRRDHPYARDLHEMARRDQHELIVMFRERFADEGLLDV